MFVGHYAAGLAIKSAYPKFNLGWVLFNVQALDFLNAGLSIAGIETAKMVEGAPATDPYILHYPISHSLAGAVVFSAVSAGLYWALTNRRVSDAKVGALIVGVAVSSHFFLDVFTHHALPLAPGSSVMLGLGIGQYVLPTIALELSLLLAAAILYWRRVRSTWLGDLTLLAFIAIIAAPFLSLLSNPPPVEPSISASMTALSIFTVFAALGALMDWFRNRQRAQMKA
jgi:membrane-bound metal-dependent hydrolase YbcI (DUF457 family)